MKSQMTRKLICILSICVVVIIILSTSYLLIFKENNNYVFYYNFEIFGQGQGEPINYTVILPLPDFKEDITYWTQKILTESNREGEFNITVINTPYGRGLMINSSSSSLCRLYINLNVSVPVDSLTMNNGEKVGDSIIYTFYAYENASSTALSLDVDMHNFEIIGADNKTGISTSVHVYPTPVGWFEYPGPTDFYM